MDVPLPIEIHEEEFRALISVISLQKKRKPALDPQCGLTGGYKVARSEPSRVMKEVTRLKKTLSRALAFKCFTEKKT
ncbi:hypothetical protein J6590_041981 [Homalodisca vitripennis]|nr:hypothetical protein J6590_041981 [Homalodisca vitripennis]